MISLSKIRQYSSQEAYTRGNILYKEYKVRVKKEMSDYAGISLEARVQGSHENEYNVSIFYNNTEDDIERYYCSCPAYEIYDGMCKHCVAAALRLLEIYGEPPASRKEQIPVTAHRPKLADYMVNNHKERATDLAVTRLISGRTMKDNARYYQPETTGRVEIIPTIYMDDRLWKVDFKIGAEQKYILKDIGEFVRALSSGAFLEYGKKLAFYHDSSAFAESDLPLAGFLRELVESEESRKSRLAGYSAYYSYNPIKRTVDLDGERMVKFARIMAGRSCETASRSGSKRNITFLNEDPVVTMELTQNEKDGIDWKLPLVRVWFGLRQLCIADGSYLYLCSSEFSKEMWEIAGLMESGPVRYHISSVDLKSFCASVLPVLERHSLLKKPDWLEEYQQKPCQIAYYLDRVTDGEECCITAEVYAYYGQERCNIMESLEVKDMYRDIGKEQKALQLMRSYFPDTNPKNTCGVITEDQTDMVYRLLTTGIQQLEQLGDVYISEYLKKLKVVSAPDLNVGVTLSEGLLDLTLMTDRFSMEELQDILTSYRKRRKYYRLKNGDFLQLEQSSLGAVAELAEGLKLQASDLAAGHIRLPEYRAFYVDQVIRANEGVLAVSRNQMFKSFLRNMKNVDDSDYELPEGLRARLRPYQEYGFKWLMTLDALGFGGILADDMGLGKTLQAIAFLLAKKQERNGGSMKALVVCPASLVYNWESEIHRFTGNLTAEALTGNAAWRRERLTLWEADVYLTSYDLLKRDVELYESLSFDYVILDEAQNIKNHQTQAAKAAKSVTAGRRFALTGTPVENSLSELWSIFDFLMPGILFTYQHFKERYEVPVTSSADQVVSDRLKRMIRPFILRRMKKDVLKELPDKMEEVVYSLMEGEQQKLYTANVQRVLDALSSQTEDEIRTGKLQILAELTRLRQLCCDPSLLYESYDKGSAKLETCMELVQNAAEGGNKVLLFSQFTSMLEIIRKRLDKSGISYYILTGQTSKENRQQMVQAFNQDDTAVFLISLKAGGTGLNLTAASMVIHYDPWWNAAAQNQATDRAHRIGQHQVVTVYKLIMKDTIEEKILKLQEKKAALSEEIITEGSLSEAFGSKDAIIELLNISIAD